MSTLETFRLIAAGAAALAVLALMFPDANPNSPRRSALIGLLTGAWALLTASLIPQGDVDRITDRLTGVGILVAVLSAVGGGEGGGGGAPASHWSAPASRLVPVGPRTAPSAWRWSGMPR